MKFHGVCVYVKNNLTGLVIQIPDEDSELKLKQTTSVCNIFAFYLLVERSDKHKTSLVWHKLIDKAKGENTILLDDLNRPLNND